MHKNELYKCDEFVDVDCEHSEDEEDEVQERLRFCEPRDIIRPVSELTP